MSSDDTSSENTFDSALYVSTIDVNLAKDSRKTIESIQLKKNDQPVKDTPKPTCFHGTHQIEFSSPLHLNPNDRISVLVNCNWWQGVTRTREAILMPIDLHDTERTRDDQGVWSYRNKERNIEVLVRGYHPFLATTTAIIRSCDRFRLLIIGNSGVGKSSLLRKVFGVEYIHTSERARGIAEINTEFCAQTNRHFVVHDSLGFESGDEGNMEIVKEFVARRKAMPQLRDQLHAIWLCLELPYAGGRLLDAGAEEFLSRRRDILGEIPLVVVLTKADQLDIQLGLDLPANEDVEQHKSKYLDKYCIEPLHKAAGGDITHVMVSVYDRYAKSLSDLVGVTDENMAKYHADDAARFIASIAQRVSIEKKIELSIAIGGKKYWGMFLRSGIFRGQTLQECLRVVHKDVVTVWNFDDPDECLTNDGIIGALLCTDNPGNPSEVTLMTALARFVQSPWNLLLESGKETPSFVACIKDVANTLRREAHSDKGDVKLIMRYIVDLVCIMHAIFVVVSGGPVTADKAALALQAYRGLRNTVHERVDAFDRGMQRNDVLDEVEHLIWRYRITDRDIEEARGKTVQV